MKKIVTYLFALIVLMFTSCIDKPIYPSEPVIAYKDFLRYGNNPSNPDSVELVVSFTDNEGDIGLEQSDTFGIFKKGNLYMDYYYYDTIVNDWVAYDLDNSTPEIDTLIYPYRVPVVLPEGDPSEPMKGLIYAKIKPWIQLPGHDKIKFVVRLYDIQLHKSDTIHTPAILF